MHVRRVLLGAGVLGAALSTAPARSADALPTVDSNAGLHGSGAHQSDPIGAIIARWMERQRNAAPSSSPAQVHTAKPPTRNTPPKARDAAAFP
jgi:hypothetical protein